MGADHGTVNRPLRSERKQQRRLGSEKTLAAADADSMDQVRGSVGAEGARRGLTFGKALVAAQMAFCLLLLVIAGLFGRSLRSLTQADIGFDRDHVLGARVDVRGAGYTTAERQALYARLIDRLRAVP